MSRLRMDDMITFECFLLQIQTKRELFFKAESGSIPSSPSVPPPQPPTAASTNNATLTSTLPPGGVPIAAPVKSRLPQTAVVQNQNDSEDSNKRESATNNRSDGKETRSAPTTKPKELDGYVGFANLPNQVYRKAVKKGFDFTLMVVGEFTLSMSINHTVDHSCSSLCLLLTSVQHVRLVLSYPTTVITEAVVLNC